MTKSLEREGITSVFRWVILAKYLPRFLTICNLDFVRPDKGEQGLTNKIFNTFCEWLAGSPCYSFIPSGPANKPDDANALWSPS
jgi:hypothetical protein